MVIDLKEQVTMLATGKIRSKLKDLSKDPPNLCTAFFSHQTTGVKTEVSYGLKTD